MIKFIRDPKNLRYGLNTTIPIIVFLTSILSAVITYRLDMSSRSNYIWVVSIALFSSFCALLAVLAMTQPIKDLMKKAERMIRFEESRKEKGELIEVYQLIERLMKLVTPEPGANPQDKKDIIEDIEKLDYIVPLGYMSLTVAHEVRNPLNTITGLSELLKENMEGRQARSYVDKILEATKKIDVFTKELLDFTDNGMMEEKFDINAIVDETVQALRPLFKEVKCDLRKVSGLFYMGDKNKLYQAVFNIVKNAFEYEKAGGYVKIETKYDDAVRISVYNRKSTIDEVDKGSIFKPFFSKKKGGRGIGLFVSMKNIKLHGGTIDLESGDGGTTFTIVLPGSKKGATGESLKEKIVIIEDDSGVRFFLEEALKGEGYTVYSFESYEEACTSIGIDIDLVIVDIKLPGVDGLTALGDIKKKGNAPVIIITAYGTKKNAIEAIKHGAEDFFIKPIALSELKVVVKRVLNKYGLTKEIEQIRKDAISGVEFNGVIGKSEAMKDIFKTVEKVAEKDISVLITGETGVGKEVIARLTHRLSGRKGDFVVVNCASIPDNLLESELFGYEKGAFTGAVQQKQGKFELAEHGTIVLDEIGEMSPYLQAKMLRVIENKEIERLGSVKKHKIDIRIMATTNRVLENEMKQGRFREDLYFRLSQIHVTIPPLRERKDDIGALISSIMPSLSNELNHVINIDNKAMDALIRYNWPGNVRELINVIRRAAFMHEGSRISIDDLPLHLRGDYALEDRVYTDRSLDEAISELEKRMIADALKKTGGQQSKAARLLGISERSMWYRVKKYEIETTSE